MTPHNVDQDGHKYIKICYVSLQFEMYDEEEQDPIIPMTIAKLKERLGL